MAPQEKGFLCTFHYDPVVEWLSCVWLFCSSVDCSPPGSSVHGIFQQENWNGLPSPSPGVFPTQGSNLHLLPSRQILYRSHQGIHYSPEALLIPCLMFLALKIDNSLRAQTGYNILVNFHSWNPQNTFFLRRSRTWHEYLWSLPYFLGLPFWLSW